MTTDERLLIVITGPTASGKTEAAVNLASALNTEIISADSRQFFRELKIGSAPPTPSELATIRHHFIGHLSVQDEYNVSRFETDALLRLNTLFEQHKVVVMVGGSGLYINAVCHGIDLLPDPDPALRQQLKDTVARDGLMVLQEKLKILDPGYAEKADMANPARVIRALEVCLTTGIPYSRLRTNTPAKRAFRIRKFAISLPREALNERINSRVDQMISAGLAGEARGLYHLRHLNALNTVGYKELFEHFDGQISLEQAITNIKTNTRRYAKRQMTWLRREQDLTWTNGRNIADEITH
jgi:tRNA dimethylallyltransferase